MLQRNLNIENSLQRTNHLSILFVQENLHSKYVTPQLYNYCMNIFFTVFQARDKKIRLYHKESVHYRDCCEYLLEYNTMDMTMKKIRQTVLKNVRNNVHYLIDFENRNDEILLAHTANKKKLKILRGKSSVKAVGSLATTAQRKSENRQKHEKMLDCRKYSNNEQNQTSNSIKNLIELKECLEIMTKKFSSSSSSRRSDNIYGFFKRNKKKQKEKENPQFCFKKAIDQEKISVILKKGKKSQVQKVNFEEEKSNLDNYGLHHIKKKEVKAMKSSKSQSSKKKMVKPHIKSMIGQGKMEQYYKKEKEENEEKVKQFPLTPNPRYHNFYSTNFQQSSSKKKKISRDNFTKAIDSLNKNSKKVLSTEKGMRSNVKSLSPK